MMGSVFPNHAVIGEETGADEPGALTWLIDPIDGTKCFVMGFPIFGSLICLMEGNCPIINVIEIPTTTERWVGPLEHIGTTFQYRLVSVRPLLGQNCRNISK
jgi:fructose-1,6-bisphosphatase/inositol monophosphatase family enzyme